MRTVLILSLNLCLPALGFAQWEQVNSGLGKYRFIRNEDVLVSPEVECANIFYRANPLDSLIGCVPSGTPGTIGVFNSGWGGDWFVLYGNGMAGWTDQKDLIHPIVNVTSVAVSGTSLFVGTRNAFRSTDYGMSWTQLNSDWLSPYSDYWIVSFLVVGTHIYAQHYSGPVLSTDNGTSWRYLGQTNDYLPIRLLTVSRTCLFAETAYDNLIRSTDFGVTWDTISYPGSPAVIDTSLFAQHSDGQIDLSTDNGTNWKMVSPGLGSDKHTTSFCSSGRYLFYMGTGDGANNYIVRKLWTDSSLVPAPEMTFPPGYVPNSTTGTLATSGSNVYLNYGGHYFSTNSGENWKSLTLPPGMTALGPFAVLGANLFVGGVGVWRTPLPSALRFQPASFEVQRCGTDSIRLIWTTLSEFNNYGFEIQRSTDGTTFCSLSGSFVRGNGTTNLFNAYTYTFRDPAVNVSYRLKQIDFDGTVYYSLPVQATHTTGLTEKNPTVFALEQNYPNPFNPSTTIRYALPRRAHVMLTLYNTLGQQVSTLVNESQEAGYHDVRFSADGLASGVYFYRLRAGECVTTRRLVILR